MLHFCCIHFIVARPASSYRSPIAESQRKLNRKETAMTQPSRQLFRSIFWITLLTIAMSSLALAQTSAGTITGQVLDSTNAAVAGATVRIVNTATNDVRVIATNSEGICSLPSLPPGQ